MEQQTLKTWEVVEQGEVNLSPKAWDFLYQLSHGVKNPTTSLSQDTIDSMKSDPEFMEEVESQRNDLLEKIRESVKFSKNGKTDYTEKKGTSDLPIVEKLKKNFLGKTIDSSIELHINTSPILISYCDTDEAVDYMIDELVKEVKNKLKSIGKAYKIYNQEKEAERNTRKQ